MADLNSKNSDQTGNEVTAEQLLNREKAFLSDLRTRGTLRRWKGYWSKTGPGWMQSAMTIGGATAMTSLFAGAFYQYKLLWVQPLAMILGIIMLAALSHQTLSRQERPFFAMKKYIHPVFAWSWAIATLVSTMIWHLPMYALVGGMTDDILKAVFAINPGPVEQNLILISIGIVTLFFAILICWNYAKGYKGIKRFENILKTVVWIIIFCFLFIVIQRSFATGIEWGKVLKGFLPLYIPTDSRGITVLMGCFSATVGINMTFLFGYTYLARGWGKEHEGLARFDLITGMLIPFLIATSLMIIATGSTIYDPAKFAGTSTKLSPIEVASMLQSAGIPMVLSRVIFGLGIVSMAFNAIILHMLVSGFAASEIFGFEAKGWKYKLACLIPSIGIMGVIMWKYIGPWIAVPASAFAGVMLPIAYIGFFILNNNRSYLKENTPKGKQKLIWNIAMIIAIAISIINVVYFLTSR